MLRQLSNTNKPSYTYTLGRGSMALHMFEDECSVVRKGNCSERGELGHRGLRGKDRFSAPIRHFSDGGMF